MKKHKVPILKWILGSFLQAVGGVLCVPGLMVMIMGIVLLSPGAGLGVLGITLVEKPKKKRKSKTP